VTELPIAELQSAFAALRLQDIVLYEARFSRPDPLKAEVPAYQRLKRTIEYTRNEVIEGENKVESLKVLIGLGVRITGTGEPEPPVYIEIEADFIAEYEITAPISEEAIKAFTGFNAVHNVWPFWRQHVFDVVQRARLQAIDVPLFSGADAQTTE
jgi:hypothetical protein